MNQIPGWLLAAAGALAGLAAGIAICVWWGKRAARMRKRIPAHWPLDPRALANSAECRIWRWLSRSFFDHHVMVKIPVTRFTLPRTQQNGLHWYNLLSGVYCTFTVCNSEGRVVGCVDVPGLNGISRSNRQLKFALLSQCGIAYTVLRPGKLPTLAEIRTEFLGDAAIPVNLAREREAAVVNAAHAKLREAIERQRSNRQPTPSDFGALAPDSQIPDSQMPPASSQFSPDSDFAGGWQQQNSFIAPLDSRSGELA